MEILIAIFLLTAGCAVVNKAVTPSKKTNKVGPGIGPGGPGWHSPGRNRKR